MLTNDYDSLFDSAGQTYDVDPALIKTVFGLESNGNANSKASSKGAQGGMQLMPLVQRMYGVTDPSDMKQAIPAAAQYLREGLTSTGTPEGALAYYHGGPDRSQWGPITASYVSNGRTLYPQMAGSFKVASNATKGSDPDEAAGMTLLNSAGKPAPAQNAPSKMDPDEAAGRALLDTAGSPPPAPAPNAPIQAPAQTGPTPDERYAANLKSANDMTPQPGQRVSSPSPDVPAPSIGQAAGSVAQAASEGFQNAPRLLSPEAQAYVDQVSPTLGGAVQTGNVLLSGLSGAFKGGQEAVAQGGAMIGQPQLGRDVAALPEAFAGSPNMLVMPKGIPGYAAGVARQAMLDRAAPLSADFKAAPVTPELAAKLNPSDNPAPSPQGASDAPNGSTVGAAQTPTGQTVPNMTPAEALAQRTTAERRQLLQTASDRAGPSGVDDTFYIPDTKLSPATIDPNGRLAPDQPVNAVAEKAAYATDAETKQAIDAANKHNNETVTDYFDSRAGDANAIQKAEAVRDELIPDWANKTGADMQPVVDTIDKILSGPSGERDTVRPVLEGIRNRLVDGDGNLKIDDPQIAYGARQNITDKLSSTGQRADPSLMLAKSELLTVKQAMDDAIEKAAPGYKQYLADYTEASKPIDAMQVLQGFRTGSGKITDANGKMQATRVQTMMDKLVNQRAAPGINPAKSIPDETMQDLFALRDHLARDQMRDDLARVKGSDTTQMLSATDKVGTSPLVSAAKRAVYYGAHAALLAKTGGIGNALLGAGKTFVDTRAANKAAAAEVSEAARLKGFRNALLPPP